MFLSSHRVVSVCFSSDGKQIASGSRDRTVKIWNASSGELQSTLNVDGRIFSVSFSPDGEFIAAGYGYPGNAIQIFKAQTGEKFQSPLTGHSERVNCVVFSPNGKVIASCSGQGYMRDNSVRLWDASTGEPIGSPLTGHTRYVPALSCSACSQSRVLLTIQRCAGPSGASALTRRARSSSHVATTRP